MVNFVDIFTKSELEIIGPIFFQVSIDFHPCHPQERTTVNSFSAITCLALLPRPLFLLGFLYAKISLALTRNNTKIA